MTARNKNIPALRFQEFKASWSKLTMKDVSLKITDGTHDTPKQLSSGVPYLTAIHVKDGKIDFESCYYLSQKDHDLIYKRCNPEYGDLLLVNIGAGTATCASVNVNYEFSLKNVALIKPDKAIIYSNYLSQYQRKNTQRLFLQLTSGGAQPFLSLKEIGKLKVEFPSLPEQKKIASFLSAIDEKIRQLTRKKELLEQYKKGMMQQLFSGKLRFKDDRGKAHPDWELKRLGEFLIYKSERNTDKKIELVLSVSNKKGFITQDEQFDGYAVASKDLSNYKVVYRNDIAYNPSRINVGSIATLKNFERGIVSPMYIVFALKNGLDINYFENLYSTHHFKYLIKIGCSGSVRDSLNFEVLANFKFNIPSLQEQKKLASFFSGIDTKIENVTAQIERTQLFKKGLLQQMFV